MKKRSMVHRLFAVTLGAVLCLASCDAHDRETKEYAPVFAFDTVFYQTVVGGEDTLVTEVAVRLDEDEKQFSRTKSESRLFLLNEAGSLTVDDQLYALIGEALAVSRRSGGAFDPTMAAVSELWDFTKGVIPSETERVDALARTGASKVTVGDGNRVDTGGTKLDLGGIAKGYAVGEILALYRESGVTGGIVSCTSSVGVTGRKADGSAFRIGLQDPDHGEELLGTLTLKDSILSTSGDYERSFTAEGVRYHHILDPETGLPAQTGLRSVTVVAAIGDGDDLPLLGARTDALSTALFVMGYGEEALNLLTEYGMEAVFVTDGQVYVTPGLKEALVLNDGQRTMTVAG